MPPTQLMLPFLRPLAPPRTCTVRTLLRFSTSAPRPLKVKQQIKHDAKQNTRQKVKRATSQWNSREDREWTPPVQTGSTETSNPDAEALPHGQIRNRNWGAKPFVGHRTIPETPALSDQMPYWIQRTASGNLPVYRDTKRGGNLHLVLVRKIYGNGQILAADLRKVLELEKELVMVEPVTGNIKIKCPKAEDLLPKVTSFLEAHKF